MIADAHNDFLTAEKCAHTRAQIVENFVKSGVKVLSCAVFTTEQNLTIEDVERFANELEQYNKKYNIAGKQICKFLLSIEDLGFVKTEQDLIRLIKLKPFSATLTWNKSNQFASGALDNGGLTYLGKKVVRVLEQNNILVDTAHLNKKSFWQFAKISTKPIYCSHANLYALKKHKRNLTNKQIKAIVQSGGFFGVTLFQDFVSNTKISSKNIANQFKFLINHFGNKNFGFGTDFFGISTQKLPIDVKDYSNLNLVAEQLKKQGHNDKIVKSLCFKNFVNFINSLKN